MTAGLLQRRECSLKKSKSQVKWSCNVSAPFSLEREEKKKEREQVHFHGIQPGQFIRRDSGFVEAASLRSSVLL